MPALIAKTFGSTLGVLLLISLVAAILWLWHPVCSNALEGCRNSVRVEATLTLHDVTGEWRCGPDWLFSCPS